MTPPTSELPAKPRPRWGRRVVFGLLVAVNAVAILAWLGLRDISVKLETAVPRDTEVVGELAPSPKSGHPQTFLLIGSDSRENVPDELGNSFGIFPGQRADVIMLVQILPRDGRVQILSVPRDLRVEIAGHGTNRVNAAYTFGGAPLIVKTITNALGISIHHYAEVDFYGFASIVDEIGGVPIEFPYAARDFKSGLRVNAGTTELDGPAALAYARSRQYQELRDGRWVSVDRGDIGRTRRQQQLVFAILSELKRPSTLLEAGRLIEVIGQHLTIDAAMTDDRMIDLAWAMKGLDPSDIEAVTLPTKGVSSGGRSYLVPMEPESTAVLEAFRSGRSLVAASEGPLKVQVLNGNGTLGAASEWADTLEAQGFEIVSVDDADSYDFSSTVVLARVDQISAAETLARALGVDHISAGSVPLGIDAIVIIGHDLNA